MIKSLIILKFRQGPQGPSQRTLRRAIRPSRVRVGIRVAVFLMLLSIVLATVGISLNLKIERWEREKTAQSHRR